MLSYDIIGDVHGQDAKLEAVLAKLGYRKRDSAYRHPSGRRAIFVGDLIDRGPGQVEVVEIVRRMIDAGSARAVMGNHELNAIGYATPRPDGDGWLRPHTASKMSQHAEFLRQVGEDSALHRDMVAWFKTLPPFLDLGAIRVCHAWWNPDFIEVAAGQSDADGSLDEGFLLASFARAGDAHRAMDGLTKGMEVDLPAGCSFEDHSGTERQEIRVRWWDEGADSYRKAALVPERYREGIPELPLPAGARLGGDGGAPVFLGHYWLSGTPTVQNAHTAVLDYGVGNDGPLVAYRWNGERELEDAGLLAV